MKVNFVHQHQTRPCSLGVSMFCSDLVYRPEPPSVQYGDACIGGVSSTESVSADTRTDVGAPGYSGGAFVVHRVGTVAG